MANFGLVELLVLGLVLFLVVGIPALVTIVLVLLNRKKH